MTINFHPVMGTLGLPVRFTITPGQWTDSPQAAWLISDPQYSRPLSLIAAEKLDCFLARYVPLGLIAHELGTQARHVAAKLDKTKVWPIPLPEPCNRFSLGTR